MSAAFAPGWRWVRLADGAVMRLWCVGASTDGPREWIACARTEAEAASMATCSLLVERDSFDRMVAAPTEPDASAGTEAAA